MIKITTRPWFEVWGSESAQNAFLKGLLAIFAIIFVAESIALAVIATRGPVLITVTATDTSRFSSDKADPAILEAELRRVLSRYLALHHTWDHRTIDEQFKKASSWVSEALVPKFEEANSLQRKIAKEKKIAQKFFIETLTLDTKNHSAQVTAEKILIVDGLRASSPLALVLRYESGPRTSDNPEGIYITAEELPPSSTQDK